MTEQEKQIQGAIDHLRQARDFLIMAGCPRAAARVRRCLKSAEGAARHAYRMAGRIEMGKRQMEKLMKNTGGV